MKKATLNAIYETLKTMDYDPEILSEIETELNRGAEKAQANRELYAPAHDVVIEALRSATAPVPMSELWEAVEGNLPDGMTKGKVQYAVTRLWVDEIAKTEGKVNTYSLR